LVFTSQFDNCEQILRSDPDAPIDSQLSFPNVQLGGA
jgi:hypothetical protein